jgi:hypothetical protein
MDTTKLAITTQSWATQGPPELLAVHPTKTSRPTLSQISQIRRSAAPSMKYWSGRRANPAVSHSNAMMSANGFQVCVTNSAPSSQGYAATKFERVAL